MVLVRTFTTPITKGHLAMFHKKKRKKESSTLKLNSTDFKNQCKETRDSPRPVTHFLFVHVLEGHHEEMKGVKMSQCHSENWFSNF